MSIASKSKKQLLSEFKLKYAEFTALKSKRDTGEITPDEVETLASSRDEIKSLQDEIDNFPDVPDLDETLGGIQAWANRPRPTAPPSAGKSTRGTGADTKSIELGESEIDKAMDAGPFKSLGHLLYCVHKSPRPGTVTDGTLGLWNQTIANYQDAVKAMPSDIKSASGMNEFYDSEGGMLVPPQFANRIWERVAGDETNLLSMVDRTPVSGNGYTVPAWNDKTRTGDVLYGGARAYWGGEAQQMTSGNPKGRDITYKLNKLYVRMDATDELLEDTIALESRLSSVAAACFTYKINQAIVSGNGSGQPLGLLASPARITQAAASGQGAGTIIGENVTAMFARRSPGSGRRLVWLYNVDIEPQLDQLNFSEGDTAATWVYIQAGGLRDNPEPRLKGARMIETEHCPTLGTEGDLILWDPASYGAIVKSTGIKGSVSMHLRFDYDETAFKWTFRMDGRPFWDAPLTPANGNTRSPIVTLSSSRT